MDATANRLCLAYLTSQNAAADKGRFARCLPFWKRAYQRAQMDFRTETPSDDDVRRAWLTVV